MADVPAQITACTIRQDFDDIPLPLKPIVSNIATTHDRIAIEIMRGCPWQCRFCQSTVIKRPLRVRSVETIVQAALESYRNTGMNEISLLSLSSSDYPHFEELVRRMHEVFGPLGVNVSLPSLRVNHQLRSVPKLMKGWRRAGMTLAPAIPRMVVGDGTGAAWFSAGIVTSIALGKVIDSSEKEFREPGAGFALFGFVGAAAIGIIELATTPHREDLEPKKQGPSIEGFSAAPLADARGTHGMTMGVLGSF